MYLDKVKILYGMFFVLLTGAANVATAQITSPIYKGVCAKYSAQQALKWYTGNFGMKAKLLESFQLVFSRTRPNDARQIYIVRAKRGMDISQYANWENNALWVDIVYNPSTQSCALDQASLYGEPIHLTK